MCLFSGAGTGYLLHIDRQTPLALSAVEVQSMAPVPIPGILVVIGALLLAWSFLGHKNEPPTIQRTRKQTTYPPTAKSKASIPPEPSTTPTPSSEPATETEEDWWTRLRESCNEITLPPGARITLDHSRPCPIVLHLEMAPPERCKRAIRSVANWFSNFSVPPRFRIVFDHCPDGSSPRHHMVNGALAYELERGGFKVISDRDSVEVLFHRPDPRWKNPETTG